jgi:phosphonate transport system substrate-binding protein
VLRFSSCQAEIAESFCRALSAFIGEKLGISTEFIGGIPWLERQRLLYRGQIDVCWICGLPYVKKRNSGESPVELLGAAVMKDPRYAEKPVYYSDVVVRAESSFRSLDDLFGAVWAYNEPGSHSGYNLIRYHLAAAGKRSGYLRRVVQSGSHQDSLRMSLAGSIDASAIDSTVLEMEFAINRSIIEKIRTIAVLGPSPAPPWVLHRSVPQDVQRSLRREFFGMHADQKGAQILKDAGVPAVRACIGPRLRSYC